MTTLVRARLRLAAVALALPFSACSGGGSFTPVHPLPAVNYTAVGASDAVGIGASVPCGTLTAVPQNCPNGTGYVPVLARALKATSASVTLLDLGISGAVLGADVRTLGNTYDSIGSATPCQPRTSDAIPGDFVTNELPSLTGHETLVTIFAGGNDTNAIVNALGCGAGGSTTQTQGAFITQWLTNFGADLQTLIAGIRQRSPGAKIVVANLPNFALIPVGAAQSATVRGALAAVSIGLDQSVIDPLASQGIPVVDLLCDPNSYATSNFFTDGFHPDDSGYAIFAAAFLAQIQAATPTAPNPNCTYASQSAVLRAPVTQAIPAFERGR